MAHVTLLNFSSNSLLGDTEAQLVAGDLPASWDEFKNRPMLTVQDTDEMAFLTPEIAMPGQYAGGTLMATIFFHHTANSGGLRFDVHVEAKTPNTDTLNMETATSWDSANSATHTMGGTAKDPRSVDVTLTNKDSVAAGDLVRFGGRRDTDHADDDAVGNGYVHALEIWEST